MINFNIFFSDPNTNVLNNTVLSLDPLQTVFELKANLISILDCDFGDINIILENYGTLDNEDSLDLPLEILGLIGERTYTLYIHNITKPDHIWRLFCSEKIIGKNPITQQGFIVKGINSSPICIACKFFCRPQEETSKVILENNFFCMCEDIKDNKCKFTQCNSYKGNKELVFKNINSILRHHSDEVYRREKAKIDEVNKEVLGRHFDINRSIKFGLQRVFHYEDKTVKEKVLSHIPIEEIKSEAEVNSLTTGLHFRDELVKSLLVWFKRRFFSWCDKPKCCKCNKPSDVYVDTQAPNQEEELWLASRTEVYKCSSCSNMCRFPRYNNPAKLCDTKTGRCGEWANLFGCVLRCFDFDVRFIDNFEDHVWNEYYSESLRRWVHIDSCENAWDSPLMYEQGWGRNMTFIIAHSTTGIYDVTRRYVKDWNLIASRRSDREIEKMNKSISAQNNLLREKVPSELIEILYERDLSEQAELFKIKDAKEAEMVGRQSGSEEWRKQRGEIK